MTILYPLALALSAVAPAIVLLYLRRPRRERREVSSLLFWRRVLERSAQQRFLGKLRNPLSLLLALLIFFLLVLALAKPEWSRPAGVRSTVVVLDERARMQAGGSFERARAAAWRIADGAGPREEVALLGLTGEPRVISPFSADSQALHGALDRSGPIDGGGAPEHTITLARNLLESRPGPKRLVLLTDRPMAVAADEVMLTGKQLDNVGILELAPRRIPASPQSMQVLLKVGNFSREDREVEVELALDDKPFDLRTERVEAGGETDAIIELPSESLQGGIGRLTARLTKQDALSVDDVARALLDAGPPKRVLLVTTGNTYLESALRADHSLQLEILRPDQWRSAMAGGFGAILWDAPWPERQSLPKGNYFFTAGSPFGLNAEELPTDAARPASAHDPLFWKVKLDGIAWPPAKKLVLPTEGWRVTPVLENTGEPLVARLEGSDGQRMVVSGLPLAATEFATRAGFPLLVSNVVAWLTQENERKTALRAGETSAATATRFDRNGFYDEAGVAVNTFNEEESDLRKSQNSGHVGAPLWIPYLHLWQWLALSALTLILTEWITYNRRLTE